MRLLHLCTIALCLLFACPPLQAQQYNFQKLSIEDGLPRSAVYSLCQDNDGFLWVGLDGGGVAVFNGKTFQTFDMADGLPSHQVRAVFQDSKGNIWFGTTEGLCKYDHKTIKVYTTEDGLCFNYVRTLAEDDHGNLWIGTNNGLSIYDGTHFKNYNIYEGLLDYKIRIIYKDKNGKMWIGTDSGINYMKGDKFVDFIDNYYLPHPTVLEIYEDKDRNLWIGTKGGLIKFKDNQHTIYTTDVGLVHNRVRAISEDQLGNIWIGTRSGVSKFDGTTFYNYHQGNGLSHDRIRDILLDDRGNLWFATYFGGIDRFSHNDLVSYTTYEGLISNQVFSIFEDSEGDIILGTFDGISKLKFKNGKLDTVKNITSIEGLLDDRVFAVLKDQNGYYWYGTQNGITISNNDEVHTITRNDGLIDNEITTIHSVDQNLFWVGTEEGVSKIEFQNFPTEYTVTNLKQDSSQFLAGNEISAIIRDSYNNLWFGFRNGKITVLTPDNQFIIPKLPDNLFNVTCLMRGKGQTIWIGTDANGLFKLRNENSYEQFPTTLNYTKKDGLESNHIYSILEDKDENIWLGTERGLDHLILDKEEVLIRVAHYGKEEGLKGSEVNENAVFEDHNNNLWFGTVEGVSSLNINSLYENQTPPDLYLTKVKLFGHTIEPDNEMGITTEGRFQIPNNFELEHFQNSIGFEFIGINLGAPDKVKYKWILEGFDEEWSEPSNRRSVNYTNLPAGTYTFSVLSTNENGIWNKEPASITFKISPPFWQTGWFISLIAIGGLVIFFMISQLRVKNLKKAKLKLEKKVSEATEELRVEKEHIELQNEEIESQKNELEEMNNAFTDSVNYAQRIQRAIMHPESSTHSVIQDKMFIFHRAKDIVSGDFFWFRDKEDSSYFTASDCTGHGVPGAFMSMIGITYLNQIVNTSKTLITPDEVLFKLRKNVITALKHEGEEKAKDGMDMGLCRIDWKTKKLHFAGSNNPMYLVRNSELTEIKADKMPIGDHDLKNEPFTPHTIDVQKGDMIYLFTDGYADQFGGPKGKKFKYKPFKFFLESIYDFPLEKQNEALGNELDRWMGNMEQVDDILVIGVRV